VNELQAFCLGVNTFCKQSGFDSDDKKAMYRLIKMAVPGENPLQQAPATYSGQPQVKSQITPSSGGAGSGALPTTPPGQTAGNSGIGAPNKAKITPPNPPDAPQGTAGVNDAGQIRMPETAPAEDVVGTTRNFGGGAAGGVQAGIASAPVAGPNSTRNFGGDPTGGVQAAPVASGTSGAPAAPIAPAGSSTPSRAADLAARRRDLLDTYNRMAEETGHTTAYNQLSGRYGIRAPIARMFADKYKKEMASEGHRPFVAPKFSGGTGPVSFKSRRNPNARMHR